MPVTWTISRWPGLSYRPMIEVPSQIQHALECTMNAKEMEREIAGVCAELHAIPGRLEALPAELRHQVAAELIAVLSRAIASVNLLLPPAPSD
jgi:hypothetical protein